MDFSDWETTPGRRFPAEYEESVVTKCTDQVQCEFFLPPHMVSVWSCVCVSLILYHSTELTRAPFSEYLPHFIQLHVNNFHFIFCSLFRLIIFGAAGWLSIAEDLTVSLQMTLRNSCDLICCSHIVTLPHTLKYRSSLLTFWLKSAVGDCVCYIIYSQFRWGPSYIWVMTWFVWVSIVSMLFRHNVTVIVVVLLA